MLVRRNHANCGLVRVGVLLPPIFFVQHPRSKQIVQLSARSLEYAI